MNSLDYIIKKIILLYIIIIACLIFTSCNDDSPFDTNIDVKMEEQFIVGQDHSYMFQSPLNYQHLVKAEEGYYFRLNDILYYGDEELETFIPLCTQPNCLHNILWIYPNSMVV